MFRRFCDPGELENLAHTVTTETILKKDSVKSSSNEQELFRAVYKEEVMATAMNGNYSSM